MFCFELLASERPLLASARLSVERTPHRAWCRACAAEFAVQDYIARCPICEEWSDQIVSGVELQVMEMEIET
jgi:hydrogenase nickel incorporation protein HypA/HybF